MERSLKDEIAIKVSILAHSSVADLELKKKPSGNLNALSVSSGKLHGPTPVKA